MCCATTLAAVLERGVTAKRPASSVLAAVTVAKHVAKLREENDPVLRRLAMTSVRQDALWRSVQRRGWRLDMPLLVSETRATWGAKAELKSELGIDLTADNDRVLAWIATRGIKVVDTSGEPSLSRDFFPTAEIPDAAQASWNVFRKARSLKSKLAKLAEFAR